MSFALRPASARDMPALAGILADWIDATPWMPRLASRKEDAETLAGLLQSHVVTVAGARWPFRRPAGFLARRGAEIDALYVAADLRGRGLGTALIEEAKGQAPALRLWTFQANEAARRFYRARGFVETGWADGTANDEGLADVRLEWARENGHDR